ncbi:MAG: type II toxin-antitoxin system RelB family antitoxin [Candidatus Arsenophonus phytopathogenicus]
MENLTIRISREDKELLKDFADFNGISVSNLLRQSALERIENEIDIKLYQRANNIMKKMTNDDVISHDELISDLGLVDVCR